MLVGILGGTVFSLKTILEKISLRSKDTTPNNFQNTTFFFSVLISIIIIPFTFRLNQAFFTNHNLILFTLVITFAIFANYFSLHAMKLGEISKIESAKMTEPLFVIILAFILSFIFGTEHFERNPIILIPALISGATLIATHLEKHHVEFKKPYIYALLGSLFYAMELVSSKFIIEYFNPFTFYFFRCFFILIFGFVFLKKESKRKLENKSKIRMLFISILWVAYSAIIYWGYQTIGVMKTTLTLMIGPVLVYFLAWKILKNKITWKNIVSATVIALSIIFATVYPLIK